jgi:hypothetical protein
MREFYARALAFLLVMFTAGMALALALVLN